MRKIPSNKPTKANHKGGKKSKASNVPVAAMICVYFGTLGTPSNTTTPYDESYGIVVSFPCADSTVTDDMLVKLNNDGSVSKIAARTDKPLGRVVSAYRKTDNTIRVATPYTAISTGIAAAGAALATGSRVCCTGMDATTNLPTLAVVATDGDWVVGEVLAGGAAGAQVTYGLYRVPMLYTGA